MEVGSVDGWIWWCLSVCTDMDVGRATRYKLRLLRLQAAVSFPSASALALQLAETGVRQSRVPRRTSTERLPSDWP